MTELIVAVFDRVDQEIVVLDNAMAARALIRDSQLAALSLNDIW